MEPRLQNEFDCVIVRYGEIALKHGNRRRFEDVLMRNIRKQLDYKGAIYDSVYRISGRFVIGSADPQAAFVASKVYGVSSTSNSVKTGPELESIKEASLELFRKHSPKSFRITARRLEKPAPLTSMEINSTVGEYVRTKAGCPVNLEDSHLELFIDYTKEAAYLHTDRLAGPEGLPVGVSGKVAVFLSGGIDSPVAAWLSMRRGCEAILIHFLHGNKKPAKIDRIRDILREYHPEVRLIYVPMDSVEKEIIMNSPAEYRIILLRRSFMRIAGILRQKYGFKAIVSGDNIGQVASQTLDNSSAIGNAAPIHWIRPLECWNKQEIIDLAKKIGTYEASVQEYADCCSFMVPKHPITCAKIDTLEEIEARIPVKVLEDAAARTWEAEG